MLSKKQEKSIEYLVVIVFFGIFWILVTMMGISSNNINNLIIMYTLITFLFIGGIFWITSETYDLIWEEINKNKENGRNKN